MSSKWCRGGGSDWVGGAPRALGNVGIVEFLESQRGQSGGYPLLNMHQPIELAAQNGRARNFAGWAMPLAVKAWPDIQGRNSRSEEEVEGGGSCPTCVRGNAVPLVGAPAALASLRLWEQRGPFFPPPERHHFFTPEAARRARGSSMHLPKPPPSALRRMHCSAHTFLNKFSG